MTLVILYVRIRTTRYFEKVPKVKWFAWQCSDAIGMGRFSETTTEYLQVPTRNPQVTFELICDRKKRVDGMFVVDRLTKCEFDKEQKERETIGGVL